MSLSLGGLAFFSLRNPFSDLFALISGKGDVRSWLCLIVFTIVSLVLAYLTNPSESSFRAYLTEQSFRLHLSRLDDQVDDLPSSFSLESPAGLCLNPSPPFYFTNRASISLRTPKHVFHSFGIFTVAAMVPLSNPDTHDNEHWSISDSWYIGAFGKWWRGGVLEAWYQDVIAHAKDEESWSSGILSMKRLDMLPDYIAPPFSTKALPTHLGKCSLPRLRNRERTTMRPKSIQPRPRTPPPLPKSVSLPLHSSKRPLLPAEIPPDLHQYQQAASQSCTVSAFGPSASSSLPLSMERSPLIAEVLRQLSAAKTSVQDLNEQLSDCQSSAAQSHVMLQHDVDEYRRRKRLEDVTKNEIRSRTKGLEESKRVAEGLRREAEKRLKTIQLCREDTSQHLNHIDQEIFTLKQQLCDDQDFLLDQHNIQEPQSGLAEALEQRRLEIKAAEGQAAALNHRSREIEEKLASAKSRLKLLQGRPDALKHGLPLEEQPVGESSRSDYSGSWFQANDERTTLNAVSHTGQSSEAQYLNTSVPPCSTEHHRPKYHPTGCSFPDPPLYLRSQPNDTNSSNLSNHSPGHKHAPTSMRDLLDLRLMGNFDFAHGCSNTKPDPPIKPTVSPSLLDNSSTIPHTFLYQPNSSVETKIMPIQNPDPSLFQYRYPFDKGGVYASEPSSPASTCPSHSLMRAFAPSPAERRAFRQALGISASTSFERLTNLGNIPTMSVSPTHSHVSMNIESGAPSTPLPGWLPNPPPRKANFSPWADEDVQDTVVAINKPEH